MATVFWDAEGILLVDFMEFVRVSGTNMGSVFLFVFDRLNIDHYLTSSSSIDGKFHFMLYITV